MSRLMLICALSTTLSACGGGGSDSCVELSTYADEITTGFLTPKPPTPDGAVWNPPWIVAPPRDKFSPPSISGPYYEPGTLPPYLCGMPVP